MNITFVHGSSQNLAIEYFSSILKKNGHSVSLIVDHQLFNNVNLKNSYLMQIFDIKELLTHDVIKTKPDLIAFSVFTSEYQWAIDFANRIKLKLPNVPIIFGGIHPTSVPEYVIKEKSIDIVCVGEGEMALLELVDSMKKGRMNLHIKNLWFKRKNKIIKNPLRPLLDNLDELPFPDKDLFYKKLPSFSRSDYLIMASRGCPFRCTYCANHVKASVFSGHGRYIRFRSVSNVIRELKWAKKKYPQIKKIILPDDILPLNKNWMREFIPLYKKVIGLPFLCYAHPRNIDEEMARLLKEGGCFWLNMGLQTPNEKNRKELINRVESNKDIQKAVENCHSVGLRFSLDHIFGIPYEGKRVYIEGLKFYNKLRPSSMNVFWLVYFPKTEIINLAIKAKLINSKTVKKINEGKVSNCATLKLSGDDIDVTRASTRKTYDNFAFLYTLLPIIPKRLMSYLIKKKWYNKISRVPNVWMIGAKIVSRLPVGQLYLYTEDLRLTLWLIMKAMSKKLTFNLTK